MLLTDLLWHHEGCRPDKVYWRQISGGNVKGHVTYSDLAKGARSYAHAYRTAGLGRGDVALIFLPQGPELMQAFLGAMLVGGIPSFMPCPSDKQHPSIYWPSHMRLLERIGPHVLLTDQHHRDQMAANGLVGEPRRTIAIEDIGPADEQIRSESVADDSIALLQHSSGTTSLKKGVALSHRSVMRQVSAYTKQLEMTEHHNIISWLPLYHDMGLIACALTPFVLGQETTCLDPYEWAARPVSLFEAIDRFSGHFVWMPNFAFSHLVRTVPDDYSGSLRQVMAFINCSEPAKATTFDAFATRFARLGVTPAQLQVCYAMAETVFAVSQTPRWSKAKSLLVDSERLSQERVAVEATGTTRATRILSTGTVVPGLTVSIRNEDVAVPDGHVGEIAINGEFLFDGYYKDPATTSERIRSGIYYTRDLGFIRDGELYVLGRKDDLLIINGRNLHAHEVEAVVSNVPGIKPGRTVAFGLFNQNAGSEDLVVVAESEEVETAALSQKVRAAVLDQTNIEVRSCRIVAPGWLVKTTSGKISRELNRIRYTETAVLPSAGDQAIAVSRDDTLARVARIISRQFDCPVASIASDTTARNVEGWDSLAHGTLMLEIERSFNIRFTESEFFELRSVGAMVACINKICNTSRTTTSRVAYESERASVVCYGEPADGPDLIVFAGRVQKFGGIGLLDFASVLLKTSFRDARKFFVSNKTQKHYLDCVDELTEQINRLSGRPKILLGNSMGGYAAMHFASRLHDVVSVLSFVPQIGPKPYQLYRQKPPQGDDPWLRFARGVHYCVIFGSEADAYELTYLRQRITDPETQRILVVPGPGHGVVGHLHSAGQLEAVLDAAARPESMATEIFEVLDLTESA